MNFTTLYTFLVMALILLACGKDPTPAPPIPVPVPGVTSVKIGSALVVGQSYKWLPAAGLDDPSLAQPMASPRCTTAYTLTVTNNCGVASSSATVHVFKKNALGELVEVKCNAEGEAL